MRESLAKKKLTEIVKLHCIYFIHSLAVNPHHSRNPLTKDINGNFASKDGPANHDLLQITHKMFLKSNKVVCSFV